MPVSSQYIRAMTTPSTLVASKAASVSCTRGSSERTYS
jgi:hypothetical protein